MMWEVQPMPEELEELADAAYRADFRRLFDRLEAARLELEACYQEALRLQQPQMTRQILEVLSGFYPDEDIGTTLPGVGPVTPHDPAAGQA